ADLGDQLPGHRAGLRVRRYRRADRDAAVAGDLGRDEPDARDVEVTIGAGEGQPGRQELPDAVAVQQRNRPVPPLGQRPRAPRGWPGAAAGARAVGALPDGKRPGKKMPGPRPARGGRPRRSSRATLSEANQAGTSPPESSSAPSSESVSSPCSAPGSISASG